MSLCVFLVQCNPLILSRSRCFFLISMHAFRVVHLKLNVGKRSSMATTRHKAAFIYTLGFFIFSCARIFLSFSYYTQEILNNFLHYHFFSLRFLHVLVVCCARYIHFVPLPSSFLFDFSFSFRFAFLFSAFLVSVYCGWCVLMPCIVLISTLHTIRTFDGCSKKEN